MLVSMSQSVRAVALGLVLMHLRQMTAQLLGVVQMQLLVLLAHTPSIQMRGRTARCLLQLLTTTVPRADLRGTIRHR